MCYRSSFRGTTLITGLLSTALLLGCETPPTAVEDAESVSDAPLAHHRPGHAGGPGGGDDDGGPGDGDGGGTEVAMAEGLTATAQSVDVKRDNKRSLEVIAGTYSVDTNLSTTRATAAGDLNPDGSVVADPSCTWDVPAGAEPLTGLLVEALDTDAHAFELTLGIDKDAALAGIASNDNHMRLATGSLTEDPTIFVGRSGGPFLAFAYSDGDADPANDDRSINDASATRTFTAAIGAGGSNGLVRAVTRFDEDGDGSLESNEPIVSMTCPLEDAFSATVAPSAS